jgi:hypothetical protein
MPRGTVLSARRAAAALAAAVLVMAGCAETAPSRGQVGNVKLVTATEEPGVGRALVTAFLFTPDGIKVGDSAVVYGAGNEVQTDFDEYQIDLVDRRGRVLGQYGIQDPRNVILEKQGWLERPSASHIARFPFKPDATAIRVLDGRRKVLAHAEISQLVESFCKAHTGQQEC